MKNPSDCGPSFDVRATISRLELLAAESFASGDWHGAQLFLMGAQSLCEGNTEDHCATLERVKAKLEGMMMQAAHVGQLYDGWTNMHEWFGLVVDWQRIEFSGGAKCWLCDARPADNDSTYIAERYKMLFSGYKIRVFSRRTILVPCCRSCAQDVTTWLGCLSIVAGVAVGLAAMYLFGAAIGAIVLAAGIAGGLIFQQKETNRILKSRGIIRSLDSWPPLVQTAAEDYQSREPDRLAMGCSGILYVAGPTICRGA